MLGTSNLTCRRCYYLVCFSLCLVFAASSAVLAQASISSSGLDMGFTASISRPEGNNAPIYLKSSDCWYNPISSDPDPASQPSLNLESGVAYAWGSGPKRNVIETNGPMSYSPEHSGYLWSFDISGDADRAFGANSIVYLQTRNNQFLSTKTAAPYVIGISTISVVDSNGAPVSGADVKLVNSHSGEYSEATTTGTGQLIFGQPLYGQPDAPYAPGLASDPYHVLVQAPGMADAVSSDHLGGSYVGQTFNVKVSASASSVDPPVSTPSSGSGSGTCAAQTIAISADDAGGSSGIPNWTDRAFPAGVQPAYLHSGSWTETITVPVAGQYTITGDCPTASNIGTLTLTVAAAAGPAVSCTSSSSGSAMAASFGTFTLAAGANTLSFGLAGQFGAVKSLYLTPGSTCGSSGSGGSGSGSGSIFDMSGFFSRLQDFFTLQQPDIDAMHAIGKKFETYGLLGAISGVYQQFQDAFGPTNTSLNPSSSDPDYWVIHFNDNSFQEKTTSEGNPAPAGYDGNTAYHVPINYSASYNYTALIPGQMDLNIYSNYFLYGRRIGLIAFWVIGVGLSLIKRFTPELRI